MIKDFMWRLNLFHWFLTPNQHEAQEGETKSKAEIAFPQQELANDDDDDDDFIKIHTISYSQALAEGFIWRRWSKNSSIDQQEREYESFVRAYHIWKEHEELGEIPNREDADSLIIQ